jgi:hypothetical protein
MKHGGSTFGPELRMEIHVHETAADNMLGLGMGIVVLIAALGVGIYVLRRKRA